MRIKAGEYNLNDFLLATHKDYFDFLFIVKKSIKEGIKQWTKPMLQLAHSQPQHVKDGLLQLVAEDGLSATRYLTFLHYGLKKYEKVYFVDNDLWKIAQEIKPDNLMLSDIKLPMPCTVLYFRNPVLINKQIISMVLVVDVKEIDADKIISLAKSTLGAEIYNSRFVDNEPKRDNRIICCFGYEGNELVKGPSMNWTDIFFDNGTVEESLLVSHNNAMKQGMITEQDSLAQKHFYSHLLSYLAMTMAYDDVKWNPIPEKMRKKFCPNPKPQKEIDFMSGVWIGKKRPSTKADEKSTGIKQKAHWRSAHWKMQPYGEKNSLRKLKWIDAYLTGKNE